ncbi:uncharacterized protein LOC116162382 [Photinus pyralis]|uniref:uncharacterized protein LOC116162382 n=1 Tax=Photinus pyralis TaxID=7054 RepID=UPI001267752D|nr:uncharacterized protein LOC116162382 [Photinus pyralis]
MSRGKLLVSLALKESEFVELNAKLGESSDNSKCSDIQNKLGPDGTFDCKESICNQDSPKYEPVYAELTPVKLYEQSTAIENENAGFISLQPFFAHSQHFTLLPSASCSTEYSEIPQERTIKILQDIVVQKGNDNLDNNGSTQLMQEETGIEGIVDVNTEVIEKGEGKEISEATDEEEYKSSTGKNKQKRKLGSGCNEKCAFKCRENLSTEERQRILTSFWQLGDITRQREFILRHITPIEPKYRYPKPNSHRKKNNAYHFSVASKQIRVCKKFFNETLNISDMMIRTAIKKTKNGVLKDDNRGKHSKKNKISEYLVTGVKEHIESIPTVESHYLRAQTKRKFFDGSLNLSTLYRLYTEKCITDNKPYVKYFHYARIFNYEYNIGFHSPKKDQCSLCTAFINSTVKEKEDMERVYKTHHEQKNLSREEKKKDIQAASLDPSVLVAVYDLQAVLPSPCGTTSDFFYKSKLSTLNLTFFNIVKKLGYCYVWDETIAKRGANEIGSFVLHFLSNFCTTYHSMIFYSDNCCGQNKNKFIAATYLYALNKWKHIHSITHKYLITGHTQNEGDSMHSTIEKEKKRMLKSNNTINVPAQWIPLIALSKKKSPPYAVYEVTQRDVYDIKVLCGNTGKNYSIDVDGKKVNWNQIKIIHFEKTHPKTIFFKTDYSQQYYNRILVDHRQRKPTISFKDIKLKCAYDRPLPISKKKYNGLMELCSKKALPLQYHQFYKNLPHEKTDKSDND